MGNVNYKNIMCDNYYCQSVSFKPEWLSESSWDISYSKIDSDNHSGDRPKEILPYTINKGVLKIINGEKFHMLLAKKLLVDFNEVKSISIPINFRYFIKNDIDIFIIFSNKMLSLTNIDELIPTSLNINYFFINLNLLKNKIYVFRSYDKNVSKKKIKSKRINTFTINLENNFNMFSISEKILNEEKYINIINFDREINNEFYLHLYIKSKYNLLKNEFIELNFE